MVRNTFPGVKCERGIWYHRKTRTRLGREYGSEEFCRLYWEAENGVKAKVRRNMGALIAHYRASDRYRNLKPRTRMDYDKVLDYIDEKAGKFGATKMQRVDVTDAIDSNRHRVRFANYIPAVLSVLFDHAMDIGWRTDNPAKGVRKLKVPKEKKQEHIPWPDWAVERFRAEASAQALLIFEIGIGTVQRPGDWPRFTWGDFDGEELRITQGKTERELFLPCTEILKAALARELARLPASPLPSAHIITGRDGGRMTYSGIAQAMKKERQRLGLLDYDLHALRYRGVMELAWAGCTDDEIASYSGHATKAMIQKYAGTARQIMRARQAREKRK